MEHKWKTKHKISDERTGRKGTITIGKKRIPTDEQVEEARIMVELDPDNQDCRSVLGRILYMKGELAEACEEYKRALQLDQNDAYSMFGLAQIYSDNDELEKAMDHLLSAVELEPDNAEFRYALGDILYGQADVLEARYHLSEAQTLQPDHEEAGELLYKIDKYLMTGRPDTAIFVHDRTSQLDMMIHYAGAVQAMILRLSEPENVFIFLNTPKGVFAKNHYIIFGVLVHAKGITREHIEQPVKDMLEGTGYPVRFKHMKSGITIEILPKNERRNG